MLRLLRDTRGIAATEFALVLPILTMMLFSIYELTFRLQVADQVERYSYQLGDYLSRSAELTDADIDEIYDVADKIMPTVDFDDSELSIVVASIGYDPDGDPVLLWVRRKGPTVLNYDLDKAIGLAPSGQSILAASIYLDTETMFSTLGGTDMKATSSSTFKPRTTRAIAINGKLTDVGGDVEGYEQ